MNETKLPFIKFPLLEVDRSIFIDANTVVAVYESHEPGACYLYCTGVNTPFLVITDPVSALTSITEARDKYNELKSNSTNTPQALESLLKEIKKCTETNPSGFISY